MTLGAGRRRTARRALIVCAIALLSIIVGVVVGVRVYLHPGNDDTADIDAVYVLGPATNQRLILAQQIADDAGGVPVIVSKPKGQPCANQERICVAAIPPTTKGEAEALRAVASEMAFTHPAVVTFTPHVARTRFIFDNCFGPGVAVVGVDVDLRIIDIAYQFAYQTAAFVKAAVTPCADPPAN